MPDGIKLGQKVKDRITGFEGTAIGRAEYLFDTPEIKVAPRGPAYRRADEPQWIKEAQLEVMLPAVAKPTPSKTPAKPEKTEVK